MKNSIKNLVVALALTGVVLTGSAFTTKASNGQLTVLNTVKKINKINVAGNVKLIIVQSAEESVKVYENYYAKNALVQQKDGELRISSFDKETLTVVVYASTLSAITASDNATVSTAGKFSTLSLDVNLSDNAKASLNTNTINLTTNVSQTANLTLSGNTEEYVAVMGNFAKVSMDNFAATSTNISSKSIIVAKVVPALQMPTADQYTF